MVTKVNDTMTEDALIKALQDAIEAQPDIEPNTITRKEFEDAMGISEYKAHKLLSQLADDGVLQRDYIARTNLWKESTRIKGYRYVGAAIKENGAK